MTYWRINEDPFYDEDGVLIDEDHDLEELETLDEDLDTFESINS